MLKADSNRMDRIKDKDEGGSKSKEERKAFFSAFILSCLC
jgi:hypothetical protein